MKLNREFCDKLNCQYLIKHTSGNFGCDMIEYDIYVAFKTKKSLERIGDDVPNHCPYHLEHFYYLNSGGENK